MFMYVYWMIEEIGLETTFPNPNRISAFVWNTRPKK